MKTINRKELSNIIGIKNLRRLTEEQIKKRLLNNCWEIISITKKGREILYTIKYKERNISTSEYVEEEFNVRNGEQFIQHSQLRIDSIEKDKPMSKGDISKMTGNSINTSYNYDTKLENKGVISKSDYYYIRKEGVKEVKITKEEYTNFWRENYALKIAFQQLGDKVEMGDITLEEYNYLYEQLRQSSNRYCYRIRKYILDANSIYYGLLKQCK